jgi:hypothetical protein
METTSGDKIRRQLTRTYTKKAAQHSRISVRCLRIAIMEACIFAGAWLANISRCQIRKESMSLGGSLTTQTMIRGSMASARRHHDKNRSWPGACS